MNSHIVQIALIVNSAMLASGMHLVPPQHMPLPVEAQQKPPMMRRELPKLKMDGTSKEAEEEMSQISINAQGKQIADDLVEDKPQEVAGTQSVVEERASLEGPAEKQRQQEAQESAPAEPAVPEEPKPEEAAAAVEEPQPQLQEGGEEKAKESTPDVAALTQESEMETSSTGVQHGQDEKVQHPGKLSDEDEELYYKLFPEDKEAEIQKAVSALEVSGARKSAFRIKVPVSGGKRLCLTEDHYGYKVRAAPCRRGSDRQKWYWVGSKLMNLFSKGRCLGLMGKKNNVAHQTDSELEGGKTEAQSHLTMSRHCSDAKAPLAWGLDEHGRLMSKFNSQCMAINEHENFHAVVLPCDKAAGEE